MKMIKTSENWLKLDRFSDIIVLDADGWDRSNFEYSFYQELIDVDEFNKRVARSTIVFNPLAPQEN